MKQALVLFARAALLLLVTTACGVKSMPRPASPALPPPVTVPGSQPVEPVR